MDVLQKLSFKTYAEWRKAGKDYSKPGLKSFMGRKSFEERRLMLIISNLRVNRGGWGKEAENCTWTTKKKV